MVVDVDWKSFTSKSPGDYTLKEVVRESYMTQQTELQS